MSHSILDFDFKYSVVSITRSTLGACFNHLGPGESLRTILLTSSNFYGTKIGQTCLQDDPRNICS